MVVGRRLETVISTARSARLFFVFCELIFGA